MSKRRKRKKRKQKKLLSYQESIAKLRSGFHKPTQTHKDKKKEADKTACRKKEVADDSQTTSRLFL